MDDDFSDIQWRPPGSEQLCTLPAGGLEKLVATADMLMKQEGALGLVGGNFYGFINRPSNDELLPSLGSGADKNRFLVGLGENQKPKIDSR